MVFKLSLFCSWLLMAIAANNQNSFSDFKFYLIPRSANECSSKQTMYIDPGDFIVRNSKTNGKVLEFPGCFTVDTKLQLYKDLPQNLITYVEWQWKQAPPGTNFNQLGCKNRQRNGCGGVGNKCFYCDSCNELSNYNDNNQSGKFPRFDCPDRAGVYTYKSRRPICVNEWGDLDKNNDGEPDFIDDPKYSDYRKFLDSLGLDGFGTVKMNFLLLSNATIGQQNQMNLQIQSFERTYEQASMEQINAELRSLGLTQVNPNNKRKTLLNFRKDQIQRQFLQRARQINRLACLEVEFDVCDSQPNPQHANNGASICT